MQFIKKLFLPEYFIKKSEQLGEIPASKKIYSTFIKMAWPTVLECFLIGLVSFIDTFMVSNAGDNAINAVSITNNPRLLFYAVFFAINIAVTAIVSRRRGEDDRRSANETLEQAISICLLLNVLLCAIAIIFAKPILIFMGASDAYLAESITYFRIIMISLIFVSLSGIINAAQRGCGNTKISMRTNITANLVNILFNFLLINGIGFFPKLGVTGAALATLIGNVVGFEMSVYSVSKPTGYLYLRLSRLMKFKKSLISLIMKVGVGALSEQLLIRVGMISYTMMVARLKPDQMYTAHNICMNFFNLTFCAGDGIGLAVSALVGQNLGRKRSDISAIYTQTGTRCGFFCALALLPVFTLGKDFIVSQFTSDPLVMQYSEDLMIISAVAIFFQILQMAYASCLRGAGDTKFIAVSFFISITLVRPILTYILAYPLGLALNGAWYALLVDQILRFIFVYIRFRKRKWTTIKL